MKSVKPHDWYLWGEFFNVYWFHGCYLEGLVYDIKERTGYGLSQIIAEQEKDITRIYLSRSEWQGIGQRYLDKVAADPQMLEALLGDIRRMADELSAFFRHLRTIDERMLSLSEQLALYKDYHAKHHVLWALGMVPNALELENSLLTNYLKGWLRSVGVTEADLVQVFQTLVTPRELSAAQKSERAMLRLVQQGATRAELLAHTAEYYCTGFGWAGPGFTVEYFESVYQGLRNDQEAQKKLADLVASQDALAERKADILRSLSVPRDVERLFRALEEIFFMKIYRVDAHLYSYGAVRPLMIALAKSQHISLNQLYYLDQLVFINMVERGALDEEKINEIGKYSVNYFDGDSIYFLVGKDARALVNPVRATLPKPEIVNELKGECAYPGKVTGTVKVVNLASEMSKFEEGNILVSNVTDPSLLPIMKKAAAFVTNQGGLTCHAAIVARELQTPCLIGTKIATHVFADGDRVEVDATKGVVKKLH